MQRQTRGGIDPELFAPSSSSGGGLRDGGKDSMATGYYYNGNFPSSTGWGQSARFGGLQQQMGGNQGEQEPVVLATLELEHMTGFTGKSKATVHAHPTDPDAYVTCMGAAVVLGNIHESHGQELLRGHDEEINLLSMANNGSMVASAQLPSRRRAGAAVIVVWDLAARRQLFSLEGFQRPILQMAFSPDDHFLVASSEDCRIMLWDMRTSELVLTKSFPAPATIVNWGRMEEKSRRPKYELTLAYSSQLLLGELAYDISGMQYKLEVAPIAMPNVGLARSYLCATITYPSMDLLAGTMAGELVVFSTEAQVYRDALPVSRNGVHSLATCRTTGFVYVGAGDGVLKKLVGRGSEMNLIGQVQLVGGITSVSVGAGGSKLFAGTTAGKTYLVNTSTLETTEIASSHLGPVTGCSFGDSCETVVTISMDGSVRLWDLSSYSLRAMATEAVGGLSIVQTPNSRPSTAHGSTSILLTGWSDGWIRAFDASTLTKKWHIANAHRGEVTSVACSRDGKFAVSGASDGGVSVWSLATRELVLQFHEHSRAVSQVLVDVGKPHWVHSCGQDKTLFIYDLKSERRVVAQQVREGAFHGISQRLDSETEIVTAGADGRLLVWDCDVPDPVMSQVSPHRSRLTCLSISPSGRFLAVGSEDSEVRVYEVAGLSVVAESAALGHSSAVNKLAWSPDERQLVSVGADACVCIWNFYLEEN